MNEVILGYHNLEQLEIMDNLSFVYEIDDGNSTSSANSSCVINAQPEFFPTGAKIAAAITFPLIFVLGLIGNLLVIIVVLRNRKMQSTTHVLIVSLAFADLLFITFCVPTTLANYVAEETPFGHVITSIADYVNYCTCYLSIYTLVLMSLDRFLAVVYATESRPYRTVRNTTLGIMTIWPIIWLSQTFMFVTETSEDCEATSSSETSASIAKTLTFFTFGYLFPLCIIVLLYGAVIRRLFLVTNVHQSERNLRSKRRAANLVVVVIACFAGSYLPLHILFIYQQFFMDSTELQLMLVMQVCANIASYMNSCINPILYAFLSRHFRDAFLQLFKDATAFICRCEQSSSSSSVDRSLSHVRRQAGKGNSAMKTSHIAAQKARNADLSDSSGESTPTPNNNNSNNNTNNQCSFKNKALMVQSPVGHDLTVINVIYADNTNGKAATCDSQKLVV